MRKISVILFLATLAGTCTTFAEQLDNDFNPETVIHDNPSQLQSIPLLQSLKNIKNNQEFRAPYVQDLKNPNAVRSLFVESQNLPMVDIQLTFNAGSARDLEIGQGLYG